MGIWASAGSRAWCPIVRAPAAELAPEQGPDRSWPQRPEAAWPGPPARCGSPRIESGPRRSGACTGPTLAGRTVQRGPGHPQRLEHFRTNRSILGRGGLGAAATERWPAPGPPRVPAGPPGQGAELVPHLVLVLLRSLRVAPAICLVTALRSAISRPTAPLLRGPRAREERQSFEDIST